MSDDSHEYDEEVFTTISEVHESLVLGDPLYKKGFEAGAASRDAEIDDLGESLAQVKLKNELLIDERDQLRDLLRPFAALLQDHNRDGLDEQPIFQINGAKITRGDLRRALAATESRS